MKNSNIVKALFLSSTLFISATSFAHHDSNMDTRMEPMPPMKHEANKETPSDLPKGGDDVSINSCWIRLLPATSPSGGFFVLRNNDKETPAILQGIESTDFAKAMLHKTTEKDGMVSMGMVHDIAIAPGSDLAFKPGSYHAMFEKPRSNLKVGDQVKIDFVFKTGKKIPVNCIIKPVNARSFN